LRSFWSSRSGVPRPLGRRTERDRTLQQSQPPVSAGLVQLPNRPRVTAGNSKSPNLIARRASFQSRQRCLSDRVPPGGPGSLACPLVSGLLAQGRPRQPVSAACPAFPRSGGTCCSRSSLPLSARARGALARLRRFAAGLAAHRRAKFVFFPNANGAGSILQRRNVVRVGGQEEPAPARGRPTGELASSVLVWTRQPGPCRTVPARR